MFNVDIQVEIMKKLPVKSLIQFRSVCKAWKSLIDSSHFIAGYNGPNNQPLHVMLRYRVRYKEENEVKYVCFVDDDDDSFSQQIFALIVPPLVQRTRTIGISHGLLCMGVYFGEPSKKQMVVLWNPAIRKSIDVAVLNPVHKRFNYVVGFGVCPDTKDPKLVKITYIHDIKKMESISCIPCQVMVFTLSSGEWTCLCSTNLPRKSIGFTCCQTVIGQFIYWLAYDRTVVDGKSRNMIMSFDLSTEEFKEVDLPLSLNKMRKSDLSVYSLRESLAVFEYNRPGKRVYTVWMMMEHGDFTKLFTVNAPNASVSQILGFRKNGEPILEIQDDNKDFDKSCALVLYEPCSKHIKDLGIHGNRYSLFGSSYMESLLLLDYEDGHIVK